MLHLSDFDESCIVGTTSGHMVRNEPLMLSLNGQKLEISMTDEPKKL